MEALIKDELVILQRKFLELQATTQRVVGLYETALHPKKNTSNEPNFKKPKKLKVEKEESKPK